MCGRDPAKIPPVSRRLDYVLQALEDVCAKLDKVVDRLGELARQNTERPGLKPLMSLKDAAAALGVSPRKVRVLIACGELPRVHVGRAISIAQQDVEVFSARNRRDWGSTRWHGKGQRRLLGHERYDDDYFERLKRRNADDQLPPLEDELRDALRTQGVPYNGQRALRIAGVRSMQKARTYTRAELMGIPGIGSTIGLRILKAIKRPKPTAPEPPVRPSEGSPPSE